MNSLRSVRQRASSSMSRACRATISSALLILLAATLTTACDHEPAAVNPPAAPKTTAAVPAPAAQPPQSSPDSLADDPFGASKRAKSTLTPSATAAVHVHGTVRDETGHVLGGAKLTLVTNGLMRMASQALNSPDDTGPDALTVKGTRSIELVSAVDGTFGSDKVAPGSIDIEVDLVGHARFNKDLGERAPGAHIDDLLVVLHTTDWVSGIVQKSDGTPVANAAIHIEGPHTGPKGRPTFFHDTVLSGPDGRFRYDGLPPGPYTLLATLGDPSGGALWKSESMPAVSGSVTTLLTLKR